VIDAATPVGGPAETAARGRASAAGLRTTASLLTYAREAAEALRWKGLRVVLLVLLIGLTEGVGLLMLVPLLQLTGLDVGPGSVDQVASLVAQVFAASGFPLELGTVLAVYMIVVSARAMLSRYEVVSTFALEKTFEARLRQRLYHAMMRADWLFFVRRQHADFVHLLTHELERAGAATFNLLNLFIKLIMAAVYLAFALLVSPAMTLLVLASGAGLMLGLRWKTALARGKGEALSRSYAAIYRAISEHLAGMKTAKSHGSERRHVDLFLKMSGDVARAHVGLVENNAAVSSWFQIGSTGILAVILYLGVGLLELPAAHILLLLYLFARLIPMMSGLQSGYQSFLAHVPSYENVKSLERDCAEAEETLRDSDQALTLQRSLEFEHLDFRYGAGDQHWGLEALSLIVEAGKTTAIVGPSGAGKSTVADLAVGLLRPTRGTLLVDGVPLTADLLASWRRSIGYVAQDTFIFHDTVRANLLLTKPEATEDDLWWALRQSAAADLVASLPQGLDTVLGDRGVRLSGGERQRLALARALLRKPALLVLDEATSSLDAENERAVQAAIDRLRGHMTILVIAHRFSTVRNADLIVVLDRGRLVESGRWDELIAKSDGRFRSLWEAQGRVAASSASVAARSDDAAVE
jgi:ATP-binding cassette, subfamily C, bacterial